MPQSRALLRQPAATPTTACDSRCGLDLGHLPAGFLHPVPRTGVKDTRLPGGYMSAGAAHHAHQCLHVTKSLLTWREAVGEAYAHSVLEARGHSTHCTVHGVRRLQDKRHSVQRYGMNMWCRSMPFNIASSGRPHLSGLWRARRLAAGR
jgi:hypothetical protein